MLAQIEDLRLANTIKNREIRSIQKPKNNFKVTCLFEVFLIFRKKKAM